MKIKNGLMMQEDFIPAYQDLLKRDILVKECLELNKCLQDFGGHIKALQSTRKNIIEKYAVKDEDGAPKTNDKGEALFKDVESAQACIKEMMELSDDTFEAKITNKIKIYDDEIFTGRKLALLEDIVEVVERPKK